VNVAGAVVLIHATWIEVARSAPLLATLHARPIVAHGFFAELALAPNGSTNANASLIMLIVNPPDKTPYKLCAGADDVGMSVIFEAHDGGAGVLVLRFGLRTKMGRFS